MRSIENKYNSTKRLKYLDIALMFDNGTYTFSALKDYQAAEEILKQFLNAFGEKQTRKVYALLSNKNKVVLKKFPESYRKVEEMMVYLDNGKVNKQYLELHKAA